MRTLIVLGLCLAFALTTTAQQAPAASVALSKHAEKVKAAVGKLAPGDKLSVIPADGPEEYGTLLSSTDDAFTFHDVDTKTDVAFRFEDVRIVRAGYGGYNNLRHRHTDRRKGVIIGVILGAALIGLVVIAASSD